jgi:vacuolar-type H+-ATPase subunit I/STV1
MEKMTVEEHVKFAEFVRDTFNKLQIARIDLSDRYGKTSKVVKKLGTVLDKLDSAKSELDNVYHAVATDADFDKYGHVYYSKK